MLEPYLRPFESGRGLQEQLRENLLSALLDGALVPTEPLPSSRKLSQLLRVSRNTVALVYEQLVHDGFLTAVDRRGFFVNEAFVRQQMRMRIQPVPRKLFAPQLLAPDWGKRLDARAVQQQQAISKPRNWRDFAYPFIYGQVEYDELTATRWRHCSRMAGTRAHMQAWMDDHVMHDDALLVEQIVQRILPRRAIRARPEQVLVTVGTQNSLYLLAQALAGPQTLFGMENPGYVDAHNIFAQTGCQIRPLRVDSQGLAPGPHLDDCDLVFCTPSHQSPTGVTMPIYRRMELLERARQRDFVLIEDDYDTEFNDLGGNHPALKSFDDSGRVIYLGSLSKNLLPGLRLGFIVADEALIEPLRALRRYVYRHPPQNNQRAMALFLWMGYGDEHARRWREQLARKWQAMHQALARHLPDCQTTSQPGSSLLWVQGPPGLDCRVLQVHAARRGVLIEPGDVHFFPHAADDPYPRQFFRLGFGALPLAQIEPGMAALGAAWRDCQAAVIKKES